MAFWKGRSNLRNSFQKRQKFRRTGRLAGRRSGVRTVGVFKPAQTFLPRTLYPQLPAEMRLSMTLSDTRTVAITSLSYPEIRTALIAPTQSADYPSAFLSMMRIYSRAVVDRVQVRQDFNPYFAGAVSDQLYGPIGIAAAVIPYSDLPNLTDYASWYKMSSLPESKTLTLGHPFAETGKSLTFSIDVRKLLASPREEDYATTSSLAGSITLPDITHPDIPYLVTYFGVHDNTISDPRYCLITRQFTFHITFSLRHLTPAS